MGCKGQVKKEGSEVTCNTAQVVFENTSVKLGVSTMSDSLVYEFRYHNTGSCPLVVLDVQTSCGCTVPYWQTEIQPSDSSSIRLIMHLEAHDSVKSANAVVIMNTEEKYHKLKLSCYRVLSLNDENHISDL